jgi:hypothetical protein
MQACKYEVREMQHQGSGKNENQGPLGLNLEKARSHVDGLLWRIVRPQAEERQPCLEDRPLIE